MKRALFSFFGFVALCFLSCSNGSSNSNDLSIIQNDSEYYKFTILHNGHGKFKITVFENGGISSNAPVYETDNFAKLKKGTGLKIIPVPEDGYNYHLLGIYAPNEENFMAGYAGSSSEADGNFISVTMPGSDVEVSIDFRIGDRKKDGKPYGKGDIIFEDGTYAGGTWNLTDGQKARAIAIIFYSNNGTHTPDGEVHLGYNRCLGIGLKHNRDGLEWCTENANAFGKYINSIEPSDSDGSNNLEQIGNFLKDKGLADDTSDENLYPAFYFAKNYKNISGSRVLGTKYEDGWYLPSYKELQAIYDFSSNWKNAGEIDGRSKACGGDVFNDNDDYCEYWTASQTIFSDSGNRMNEPQVKYFHFGYQNMTSEKFALFKTKKYVCVIREF